MMQTASAHRIRVFLRGDDVCVAARKGVLLEADRAALARHREAVAVALSSRMKGDVDLDMQSDGDKCRWILARCEEPGISITLPSGERFTSCPMPDLALVERHPAVWESFTAKVAALIVRGVLPRVAERLVFSEIVGPLPHGHGAGAPLACGGDADQSPSGDA